MGQDLEDPHFRLNACLKKALGKELTPAEREVIREVNRIQGWDKGERSLSTKGASE